MVTWEFSAAIARIRVPAETDILSWGVRRVKIRVPVPTWTREKDVLANARAILYHRL
jgi:hypothetical protein